MRATQEPNDLSGFEGRSWRRACSVRHLYQELESREFKSGRSVRRERYAVRLAGEAVDTASAVELTAIGPEARIEPTGAYGLGTEVADALEKSAVGRDKDDAAGGRGGLRHQSVVAVVGGVDDAHAVNVCLSDAGPGGAFEDYHCR